MTDSRLVEAARTLSRPEQGPSPPTDTVLRQNTRSAADEKLYGELSRLNNDLATMQRELASRNRTLELRNNELCQMRELLEVKQAELLAANEILQVLSITDTLTGIGNRRYMQMRLEDELARVARTHGPLSLMLLDIDRFKNYNDTFGHLAGDEALKIMAKILQKHARKTDTVSRFGGEEFVVLYPDADRAAVEALAERLRTHVHEATWPHRPVTVSMGIASIERDSCAAETLLNQADQALYRAKFQGRDQAIHYVDILHNESDCRNKL
ncbi:MAG: GGDEF domain-containing protein [Phycisphaerae bacterium]